MKYDDFIMNTFKAIEAPEDYVYQNGDGYCHFLAGGITGCPDWQAEAIEMLKESNLVIFNPRRKIFWSNDPLSAMEQITWEHDHLRKAHAIIFWFPCETLCPIVLYELGAWSMTTKPIYVGVHPDYPRKMDVEVQTKLVRPNVKIVYSLENLIDQVLQR